MSEADRSAADQVFDLLYGDLEEQDDGTNEEKDSPEGKPEVSDPEAEQPAPESGEPEKTEGEPKDGDEPEEAATEDDDDGEFVVVDGEKVPVDTVREWKQGHLRQDDYTRKSQERENLHRDWEEKISRRDALVNDIVADESFREFLSAHPDALPYLLQMPDEARKLIGNDREIRAFWDDYEIIKGNPSLAQRLGSGPAAVERVDEAIVQERIRSNVMTVANALDHAVDTLAGEFDGVDPDEVKAFVLSLGRYPESENPDPSAVVDAFERLYGLFFAQDGEGQLYVDNTLIRNEYERLHATQRLSASREERAADEHNKAVDEQLQDAPEAPATPGRGGAAPVAEEQREYKDVSDVIGDLLYGE